MTNIDIESRIRLFTLANSLTENQLDKVEKGLDLDLGRSQPIEVKKKDFYLQFGVDFRREAKEMAEHYEVFYCLEKSIRNLIMAL